MAIIRALGREIGLGAARSLCSRHGAAFVVAGTLALAGGASPYLEQHATQDVSRIPGAQVGQSGCGLLGSGYISETNQFYCVPNQP